MVVMLILAVFSTLLTLRIESVFSGGDMRLAGRMIINQFNRLRGEAIYGRTTQLLTLSIERNVLYSPGRVSGEKESWETDIEQMNNEQPLPAGVEFMDVVVLSQGKIQEGEATIRFYPNGCIEQSLIHIRNEDQEVYTLEINPMTGQIELHDRYIDQKMGP